VVKVRPTKYCLIAISEFPSFVIDLKDIEAVHFERVSFGIKNFDMAIIFKDFHTFKRINSIPRESIDQIKDYLNKIGIIFSEGVVPMNWATLSQIRTEFQDFLDEGGWKFLQNDEQSGGEGESDEDAEDGAFKSEDEDEESDDDSEFSDENSDEVSEEFSGSEVVPMKMKVLIGTRWRKELTRRIKEQLLGDKKMVIGRAELLGNPREEDD